MLARILNGSWLLEAFVAVLRVLGSLIVNSVVAIWLLSLMALSLSWVPSIFLGNALEGSLYPNLEGPPRFFLMAGMIVFFVSMVAFFILACTDAGTEVVFSIFRSVARRLGGLFGWAAVTSLCGLIFIGLVSVFAPNVGNYAGFATVVLASTGYAWAGWRTFCAPHSYDDGPVIFDLEFDPANRRGLCR